jgi:UDP:flavonoid glycosyltransferase YjiC (YdhE family)
MRAVITSFGTAGCTQPVLALACEMRRGGHEPVVALPRNYEQQAKRLGIEFVPLGPEFRQEKELRAIISHAHAEPRKLTSFDYLNSIGSLLSRAFEQVFEELRDASASADVLISKASQPVARMVHELTGIPFVSFHTFYVPGSPQLGKEGTDAYRRVTELYVNRFRTKLGLSELSNPLTRNGDSQLLTLFAVSPHVIPQPESWPANYQMTGYFFLDAEGWEPDPELHAFVEQAEPPVVVSFGSMIHEDSRKVTDIIVEAMKIAGCRAIIQRGSSRLGRETLTPGIITTGAVPHSWLFPRAACVVHHGGSGTTAATLRAGVPSVIVPHTYDQPLWASIAESLGCAGTPLPFAEMTSQRLAWAVSVALSSPRFRKSAEDLSGRIRSENGVRTARVMIEQSVAGRKPLARSTPS